MSPRIQTLKLLCIFHGQRISLKQDLSQISHFLFGSLLFCLESTQFLVLTILGSGVAPTALHNLRRSHFDISLTTNILYLLQKCCAISPTLPPVTITEHPVSAIDLICWNRKETQFTFESQHTKLGTYNKYDQIRFRRDGTNAHAVLLKSFLYVCALYGLKKTKDKKQEILVNCETEYTRMTKLKYYYQTFWYGLFNAWYHLFRSFSFFPKSEVMVFYIP